MKFSTKLIGIGLALAVASSSASAIVTTWDYSITSLFTAATYDNGSGGAIPGAGVDTLSWGSVGTARSSLVVGNSPATGGLTTYLGSSVPSVSPYLGFSTSLTHNNNPIQGTSLLTAVLSNTVVLTPTSPANSALPAQLFPFTIGFAETPNTRPCAVSGSGTSVCNDIFVLTGGLLNSNFQYDDGTGAATYFVNIFPTTGGVLGTLNTAACSAAGQSPGCVGFSTREGESTTLAFGFTISTNPLQVPEPGMLALFGLGLMALVALRRRIV